MRKATGKVVSLVLALALVVTSFSSIAAFAATKTETGTATVDTNKDLYLANTNGVDKPPEGSKYFNLTDYIFNDGVKLETYDHIEINDGNGDKDTIEISQVTVSGSSIVKVVKVNSSNASLYEAADAEDGDYIVSVRDAKGTGSATLNVLLTGKTNDRGGDDEITVRGSVQIKLTLLDAKTPILTTGTAFGEEPDSIDGLQKNPNGTVKVEDEKDPVSATTATAFVVKPVAKGTAIASYDPQTVVEKNDNNTGYKKDGYVVAATGTRNYIDVSGNKITFGVTEPAVGNTVRLSVYSTKENTEKKIVTDKTVAQGTSKVENKVVGKVVSIDVGDGSKDTVNGKDDTLLSKSKTYAKMDDDKYWDVTGAEVKDEDAGLLITAGRLGNVSTSGTVTVNDGTVGTLSTSGTMNLDGGSVSVAKDAATINVNGATVGEIKDAATVTVTSGKVTGAVNATDVSLSPLNDEEPVSVGAVKAVTLTVDGTNAAAAAASFFAKETEENPNSSVELIGKNASLGAVDFDYRNTVMTLHGFVGTVPAPTKGTYTGYDATGATITTDSEGETNATISGNLAIANINLESGTVAFTGNVKVDNVGGSEATMVINAGALNITESVATSNTLKIADAADVAAGTVVYTAASEIADESSFVGYGYTVKVVSGKTTDAFVIDSISFSGLTMNKTEAKILLGTSETFTASVYPNGTTMPEGAYIKFFLDGDENYVSGVDNGNGTATITAKKYDATFDVLNKATLTAQVYDQYDIQLEEYGEATCAITVIEKPETTYVSDTTGNVNVVAGNTYQFKITSTNGAVPQFAVAGDGSIFKLVAQSNEGNDYFFKVQAVGTVGQVCGVYVNKEATPVATLTVSADYTCDTTTVNVAVGATYQVKITANSMPTLAAGNSIYTVAFASQSGNDYFFKITATQNAKAGDAVGFYINGAPSPAFVATTV